MSQEDGASEDVTEERVRRLLVSAARPEPAVPADVVARLDGVLADLVAERAEEDATVPSAVSLDSRRRRWPQVLVAAAAVSVLGLGIGTVVREGGIMAAQEDAASAGSGAESADRPETLSEKGAGAPATDDTDTQGAGGLNRTAVLRLRSTSLDLDLQRAADFALAVPAGARWSAACVRPATTEGDEWLPVRLDGAPAVLLLREPSGDRRRADVYTCDDEDEPAATGTVDTR